VEADHGVAPHASGPTIRFGQGSVRSDVHPIHVAPTGTVRVQMVIEVMEGDAGAMVNYTVIDDDNVVTTGFYVADTADFEFGFDPEDPNDFEPFLGKQPTVLNIGGSTGAVDYVKYANYPDNIIPGTDGDFDLDGDVDGADFLKWQRELGDAVNLGLWQDNYGNANSVASASAVPEPSSVTLLGLMLVGLATRRRRRN